MFDDVGAFFELNHVNPKKIYRNQLHRMKKIVNSYFGICTKKKIYFL